MGGRRLAGAGAAGPDFISILITKSIFSKTGGKGEKGVGGEGPEELTHILHLAADTCSPSREFLALCPSAATPGAQEMLRQQQLAAADPGRATSSALSAIFFCPRAGGSGQVKD